VVRGIAFHLETANDVYLSRVLSYQGTPRLSRLDIMHHLQLV